MQKTSIRPILCIKKPDFPPLQDTLQPYLLRSDRSDSQRRKMVCYQLNKPQNYVLKLKTDNKDVT